MDREQKKAARRRCANDDGRRNNWDNEMMTWLWIRIGVGVWVSTPTINSEIRDARHSGGRWDICLQHDEIPQVEYGLLVRVYANRSLLSNRELSSVLHISKP